MVAKQEVSCSDRVKWIVETLFHQAVAFVSIYIIWRTFGIFETNSKFLWHVVLATLAYVPLMAEGILLFSDHSSWLRSVKRTTKYTIHGICLTVSAIAVTVGCIMMIQHKKFHHFKSNHAITGLTSWVLSVASVIFGLFANYSQQLSRFTRPVIIKCIHNFIGIAAYVIGIASLLLEVKNSRMFGETDWERNTLVVMTSLITGVSLTGAFVSLYTQITAIFT